MLKPVVGKRYNWQNQPERLIYLGNNLLGNNGFWHQFAKVEEPKKVWCEVKGADLEYFEETKKVSLAALIDAYTATVVAYGLDTSTNDTELTHVKERRAELDAVIDELWKDSERLDWMEGAASSNVFKIGKTWYTRYDYQQPHKRRNSLREAIDAART